MILAQLTNAAAGGPITLPDPHSPSAIGWACIIGVCIITGLRQVMAFVREMKEGEGAKKRDVTINTGAPSKAEFDKHVEDHAQTVKDLFAKIGGVERGAHRAADEKVNALQALQREEVRTLHNKIDDVGKKVSALEATNNVQNQRMASMDAKLDRLIERKAQ